MRPAPRNPNDAASVAVDGRDNRPSRPNVTPMFVPGSLRSALFSEAAWPAGAPAPAAALDVLAHGEVTSAPGLVPAVADAPRHDEPLGLAPFVPALEGAVKIEGVVPLGSVQALLIWPVAGNPAEVPAKRHADAEGAPAAPLPSAPPTENCSDAVDGPLPHIVPTLASVGTPGDASAVVHVDADVGSSNDPRPLADPANEPLAVVRVRALTRESDVETLV
jgi:hypothetical protein